MAETFDFIVTGGGFAEAVVAARLYEGPTYRVALLEAGEPPPQVEPFGGVLFCTDPRVFPE